MAKIAIIGTGMAGMGCAHFLNRHHDLTIFEAGSHVGGHANTIAAPALSAGPGSNRDIPIDAGFMVYNPDGYPLLARLFAQLQVPVKKTTVTFSVRDDRDGLEWCGSSLDGLFAQRKNLLNLRFLKLLASIRRFNREASAALADPATASLTLGEYLRGRGYGTDLFNHYLCPAGAAVWHVAPGQLPAFPAATFLRFFEHHSFLGAGGRHTWFTVAGGAREYRDRLIAPWRGLIQLGRTVVRIMRNPRASAGGSGGVTLMTADGASHLFDKVIVATHADQALRLLVNPTADESRLLGEFHYQPVTATIHTDASVLPRTPRARAAYNHQLSLDTGGNLRPALHYWVNAIQGISAGENYFVSLNRPDLIDPAKIIRQLDYTHPIFTLGTLHAQAEFPRLNEQASGRTETYFAGSYFRDGFHEDALMSAVKLGEILLDRDPWTA